MDSHRMDRVPHRLPGRAMSERRAEVDMQPARFDTQEFVLVRVRTRERCCQEQDYVICKNSGCEVENEELEVGAAGYVRCRNEGHV